MFKVNNKDTRTTLIIKILGRRSGIFIVNFEHILHLLLEFLLLTFGVVLVSLLLTLNVFHSLF